MYKMSSATLILMVVTVIIIMDISVVQDLGHNVPYEKLQKTV